jgi:hypothetical protein
LTFFRILSVAQRLTLNRHRMISSHARFDSVTSSSEDSALASGTGDTDSDLMDDDKEGTAADDRDGIHADMDLDKTKTKAEVADATPSTAPLLPRANRVDAVCAALYTHS